jgi:hypothetical protein
MAYESNAISSATPLAVQREEPTRSAHNAERKVARNRHRAGTAKAEVGRKKSKGPLAF